MDTNLANKMITIANHDNLPLDHELRVHASFFENATHEYFNTTISIKKFLSVFAKARRIYCEYTGEPLV